MAFMVKKSVTFAPPAPFTVIQEARSLLVSYGWPNDEMTIDSGPAGAISSPETRTVTFTLAGKPGADQSTADADVTNALSLTSSGVNTIEHVVTSAESAFTAALGSTAKAVGNAIGQGVGGAVDGASKGSGISKGGLLGFGAVTSVAVIGVAVIALVFAVKRL